MSNLASFLKSSGLRQADFAEFVGVGQATISRLARGKFKPSLDLAISIERATQGRVPAASWVIRFDGCVGTQKNDQGNEVEHG